jgi:hypothetical protein
LASVYPRFIDVNRVRVFERVLETGDTPPASETVMLLTGDQENLRIALAVPTGGTARAWQTWFSALFTLAEPMIPNGGAPALERFIRSKRVSEALIGAPPAIHEKVEFLLLVGSRDLDGIRREARLLAGPIQVTDAIFHAYVFIATNTACLAGNPDVSCRSIIAQLDRVPAGRAVIDLLRAHKAALR